MPAAAWGGYVAPMEGGLLFGATHDRGDTGTDVRQADHARNRAALAAALPRLAGELAETPLDGRASIRATTPDRLPVAGPVEGAPGVFVLGGLGSRGFCRAPLLGEHLAALAMGRPSPLSAEAARRLSATRWLTEGDNAV